MSKPTVILLHGLMRTKYSMSLLGRDLKRLGYTVHNYGYRSRKFKIARQAELLRDFIAKNVRPGEPLCFVTHSLGSIILRRFALDFGAGYNLRRAVMLGPPNRGCNFADRLRAVPFLSRILGCAFLELCKLNIPPGTGTLDVGIIAGGRGNTRGYSPFIKGDNDAIVSVEETYLDGAKRHKVLPALHSFIMYYPRVRREAIHFLETGEFSDAER